MTTKEKQLKMLEALDLRVGDVVEIKMNYAKYILRIIEDGKNIFLKEYDTKTEYNIYILIYYNYEVVEYHQKTYGEYTCKELKCPECPIRFLDCFGTIEETLSDKLKKNEFKFPRSEKGNKIYEICKDILNEVRDEK